MVCKVFLLLSIIVAVRGSIIPQPYHIVTPYIRTNPIDYDDNPQYNFSYDVNDPHTGDIKNQQESRSGDVVHGQYSLVEPDGMRRTVDYASDPVHGFNAVIRRDPVVITSETASETHDEITTTTTTPVPITTTQEPLIETAHHASSHVNIIRPHQNIFVHNLPHYTNRIGTIHLIPHNIRLIPTSDFAPYGH